MTERWTQRRGVAMHEAGHAVAAFKLGRAFTTVSIIPDKDTLGRVHSRPPGSWFRPDIGVTGRGRVFIEHHIMILLAGFEAEEAWCRTVSGKPHDWRKRLIDVRISTPTTPSISPTTPAPALTNLSLSSNGNDSGSSPW